MGNEDDKLIAQCNTRGGWDYERNAPNVSPASLKVHFENHFTEQSRFVALLKRLIADYGQCDIPQGGEFPADVQPNLLNFGGEESKRKSRDGGRPYLVYGTYQEVEFVAKVHQINDRPPWMVLIPDDRGKGVGMDNSLLPIVRYLDKYRENCIEHLLQDRADSLDAEREAVRNFFSDFNDQVVQPFLTLLTPSLVQETMAIQPWLKDNIHTMATALFMGADADTSQIQTNVYGNDFLRKPEDTLRFIDQNMGSENKASCSHGSTRACILFKSVYSKNYISKSK